MGHGRLSASRDGTAGRSLLRKCAVRLMLAWFLLRIVKEQARGCATDGHTSRRWRARKLMPRFERYASVQLLDGLLQSIAQPPTS
jgi:hypothetical protein